MAVSGVVPMFRQRWSDLSQRKAYRAAAFLCCVANELAINAFAILPLAAGSVSSMKSTCVYSGAAIATALDMKDKELLPVVVLGGVTVGGAIVWWTCGIWAKGLCIPGPMVA